MVGFLDVRAKHRYNLLEVRSCTFAKIENLGNISVEFLLVVLRFRSFERDHEEVKSGINASQTFFNSGLGIWGCGRQVLFLSNGLDIVG